MNLDKRLLDIWSNEKLLRNNLIGLITSCPFELGREDLERNCHPELIKLRKQKQPEVFQYVLKEMDIELIKEIIVYHIDCFNKANRDYSLRN